jgi:hypothetical protein
LLADVAISFSRNPFVANDGARAIGANDDDDDDAAAAAPALDSNQLRGHRQQIGKSAALTVGGGPRGDGQNQPRGRLRHHPDRGYYR